jgi:Kef-type K+ transport system membrane component KefB
VLCLTLSYCAEKFFGIADITGAYIAGIILCNIQDSHYIEEKIDVSSYMIFGPVFFASIGLKTTFEGMTWELLIFSLAFVLVGCIAKIIGCGLVSKLCGFSGNESLKIGIGMMTRGEVALIVGQKGLAVGLLDPIYFTSVILLIIVSSIATPIILKLLFSKDARLEAI